MKKQPPLQQTPGHVFDGGRCYKCGSEKVIHPAVLICEKCLTAVLRKLAGL